MENKILKPENLKVGYWYKTNETHSWLFKFTRKTKDRIFGTHFCTPFDMYYIKDYHKEMDDNCINYIEATKAEVAKMFPKEIYTNKPMKQPKQEMENKKIVGYKFKKGLWKNLGKEEFLKAVAQIGLIHEAIEKPNEKEILEDVFNIPDVKRHFVNAGVLDLWFEPVYEPIQIKIGSYNVEFLPKGSIKIDCAHYTLADVKTCLKVLELPNALHISFAGSIVNKEIINKILNRVKK